MSESKNLDEHPGTASDERRPVILLSTDEHVANEAAVLALSKNPLVFVRGSVLCEPQLDAVGGWGVAPMTKGRCRELLTKSAYFQKQTERGVRPAHPTDWLVSAVMERPWYPMRKLNAVVEAPILTPGGEALTEAGYDENSGVLFIPSTTYQPPVKTDRRGARACADEVLEVVGDFPFATAADKAALLAAILTPLCQYAIRGDTPLFAFDGNVPGVGKTLLASVAATLSTGKPAAKMIYSGSGAEMRKTITGLAMSGARFVLLDNVDRELGGAALDAALTCGGVWQDRLLRYNMVPRFLLQTVFSASGNGLTYRRDMSRRVLPIRLVARHEAPESRTGFRHKGLLAWLKRRRGHLTPAALSIVLSYVDAGSPEQSLASWGSYESWSRLVRGAIVWVGLPDPIQSRDHVRRANPEGDAFATLLEQWPDLANEVGEQVARGIFACSAAHALEVIQDPRHESYDEYRPLREALSILRPTGLNAKSLGMLLRRHADRVVGGQMLASKNTRLGNRWFVTEVQDRGTRGTGGTCNAGGPK